MGQNVDVDTAIKKFFMIEVTKYLATINETETCPDKAKYCIPNCAVRTSQVIRI
jgi:hypothetical protein